MKKLRFSKFKRKPGDDERAIREVEAEIDYYLRALCAVSGETPEVILTHAGQMLASVFHAGDTMSGALEWLWRQGYPRCPQRWKPPGETVVGQLLAAEDALKNGRGNDKQLKAFAKFVRGQLEAEERDF